MKKVYALIIVLLFTAVLQHGAAKKLATLEGLMRPDMTVFGNDRLYVTEKASIYIYSLKDFKLIKKFGKAGEGPQEFKVIQFGTPLIAIPLKGKLYVASFGKLSMFNAEGEYISEQVIPPFIVPIPFLDKWLGTGMANNEKKESLLSVCLYNGKFEKEKELYITDFKVGQSFVMDMPMTSFAFLPDKDRIYLAAGKDGFAIDVFDKTGKKLYRISREHKPMKVGADYKDKTEAWFKHDPDYRVAWDFFKTRLSYKTHYPAIREMFVEDDRIYVLTYKNKDELSELIIMDLKGKEQKRVFVNAPLRMGMDYYPKYTIYNKAFYTLLENEEDETWELFKDDVIK